MTGVNENLVERMCEFVRDGTRDLGRRGAVVGVSGGVDSAVTLTLAVQALGAERVLAVALPERENTADSLDNARLLAGQLGCPIVVDDVTAALDALGCYQGRDAAVRDLGVTYDPPTDRLSVRLVQDVKGARLPAVYVVDVAHPDGSIETRRMTSEAYRSIFAYSNMKQRVRTLRLYFHAEALHYAVAGTSNFDEEYLGFFVKLGDGSWDLCPIERCTKREVFQLARVLGVPEVIISRPTTTDTFPNDGQPQQEMFYSLPFEELDVALEVLRGDRDVSSLVEMLGWTEEETSNVMANLERRHRSTRWARASGIRFSSSR